MSGANPRPPQYNYAEYYWPELPEESPHPADAGSSPSTSSSLPPPYPFIALPPLPPLPLPPPPPPPIPPLLFNPRPGAVTEPAGRIYFSPSLYDSRDFSSGMSQASPSPTSHAFDELLHQIAWSQRVSQAEQGDIWASWTTAILDIRDWRHRDRTNDVFEDMKTRRTNLWRMAQVPIAGVKKSKHLFTLTTPDARVAHTLRCKVAPGSPIRPLPLQQLHISPHAISPETADVTCDSMSLSRLLSHLNFLFGTNTRLSSDATLGTLLQGFIDDRCDLGQVYGYLRPWWFSGQPFSDIRDRMKILQSEDLELRRKAIDSDRIVNSNIPPRRVWDLYSNRVLPFHVLHSSSPGLPKNLWGVSHSWVDESQRQSVLTSINGQQWPVPIPEGTSLDNIRIELLNMGAEYVFLDVLCLRQAGVDGTNELQRLKEWRLDVPTLGHIYRHDRYQTTIIYFNGLGLPLDAHSDVFASSRHWFNRVWTLQEANANWLPGGLHAGFSDTDSSGRMLFAKHLEETLQLARLERSSILQLLQAIRARPGFSTEVDRVAALAYFLHCPTLPIYDPGMKAEAAWSLLIENMDGRHLTDLLFRYPAPGPIHSWRPSWEQAMTTTLSPPAHTSTVYAPHEILTYYHRYRPELGYRQDADAYFHSAYVVENCKILENKVHVDDREYSIAENCNATYDTGVKLALVGVAGLSLWIVGEIVGKRRIGSEMAAEMKKVAVVQISSFVEAQNLRMLEVDKRLIVYC